MYINHVLDELGVKRPIFHNEADFQHALAWEIHNNHKDIDIRLEKFVEGKYIDIWAETEKIIYVFELKYKTRNKKDKNGIFEIFNYSNEEFQLKNQGAQDLARYDFFKDIERLQNIGNSFKNKKVIRYAIFLTNEKLYWESFKKTNNPIDREFRLHYGKITQGEHKWQGDYKETTIKNREDSITIKKEHETKWLLYGQEKKIKNDSGENIIFKYLLIEPS